MSQYGRADCTDTNRSNAPAPKSQAKRPRQMKTFTSTTILFLLLTVGCTPGRISVDDGDIDGTDDEVGHASGEPESDFGSAEYPTAGLWGPCPIDGSVSTITLCDDDGVACVPSMHGTMCLPIGECPEWPGFATHLSMGWGFACYPRCDSDADCAPGMICDTSLNFESMCSWPTIDDCAGSLGCWCDNGTCAENLKCTNGVCTLCPDGQIGCDCQAGDSCDVGLSCVAGICQP